MKRQATVQITQLDPEANESTENHGSGINMELFQTRDITRPKSLLSKPRLEFHNPFSNSTGKIPALFTTPSVQSNDRELHLCGLNKSFQTHLGKLLERDQALDLTPWMQKYREYLKEIDAKHILPQEPRKDLEPMSSDEDESPAIDQQVWDPSVQETGEEGETVEHAVRCRLHVFPMAEKKWIPLGLASVRINSNNGKYRLLARAQAPTKKILANFFLVPGNVDRQTNSVSIMGLDLEGKLAKYLLRTKGPEEAKQLQNKLLLFIPGPNEQ